ncbi:hypothetical protein SISSUDRAFT_1049558, partial [Sistotremastrum suecicum HHB10207 ss-3]
MGRQILPVARLRDDFDGVPQDGMEYLFTVRRDARALPHTTRAPNPFKNVQEITQTPSLSTSTHLPRRNKRIERPSEEWRITFEERFRNLRLNAVQSTIHVALPSSSSSGPIVPVTLDRERWRAFLDGKPASEWNPPPKTKRQEQRIREREGEYRPIKRQRTEDYDGYLATDRREPSAEHERAESPAVLVFTEDGQEVETGGIPKDQGPQAPSSASHPDPIKQEDIPAESETYKSREPSPLLLSHITGRGPVHLLRAFTYWLRHRRPRSDEATMRIYAVELSHARWIFALLIKVDEHLTSDDISFLRELARACLEVIGDSYRELPSTSQSDEQDEEGELTETSARKPDFRETGPWWSVVAAVASIWGQKDLWMDAEEIILKDI